MRAAASPSPRSALVVIGTLLLSTLGLSTALAISALRPRPVVVIPGVSESRVVLPEEVPDAAVQRFGLLYLAYFDGYTPATIEQRSNHVLKLVAPELLESVARSLSDRGTYAVRARESSTLLLPLPSECEVVHLAKGIVRFSARAERRIHIAGVLKSIEQLRYALDLRPALPTTDDPYGFVVTGQSIVLEGREEVGDDRR